mmetsp:Transcript_1765/g.2360  ORF Transcript_1765/g.2360 Transcript_1765/m.2360 type:complete len:261 (-) Transcript_1765:1445-2227(-)|eukprot:CAMPEP_0116070240 /NCGR_PEP_ID=MMETSP0322-20121206/12886_1 /TAXON_ID=163516 /ORGANISM="Leptocylindrus danicus var. apora, Strain B651" /LENGTH=260 /DNA_ID=CAMNT_0003557999 /DNA_START=20 /DNA_END=802 /DNA_ORIENTATION=-
MTVSLSLESPDTCPDDLRCNNGSKCVADPVHEGMYFCDCGAILGAQVFAGRYCEFSSSTFCQVDPQEKVEYTLTFCVNGGTCKKTYDVASPVSHIGCDCPDNFEGERCEYVKGSAPRSLNQSMNESGGSGNDILVAVLISLTCFSIVLAAVLFYWRRKKSKSAFEDQMPLKRATGESSMPTSAESIRNRFDDEGANSYPVLLEQLAKSGSRDRSTSPSKRRSQRSHRGGGNDKPVRNSRNNVSFSVPDDENEKWEHGQIA